jgi:hypothetical protein
VAELEDAAAGDAGGHAGDAVTEFRPGDRVRVEGVVVELRAGLVPVREDKLFGRPVV